MAKVIMLILINIEITFLYHDCLLILGNKYFIALLHLN